MPSQGYQLPLTPAELYRAGIRATNEHCMKAYGKPFDKVSETQREDVLQALNGGTLTFRTINDPISVIVGMTVFLKLL